MSEYQIAIETIGKTGSLAILKDETVVSTRQLPSDRRTAAVLAVSLDQLLGELRHSGISLNSVSVAVGPGSFTGIRIGVTAAKMLAYALGLPIFPVGSLAALAINADPAGGPRSSASVAVAINAYRGQVYAATFTAEELGATNPSAWENRAEVLSKGDWQDRVAKIAAAGPVALVGDREMMPDGQRQLFCNSAVPPAIGVGRIASRMRSELGADAAGTDPFAVLPRYLKPSAAEEKASTR
ncbi:MAG: tRNA (adenosine(37)-N6)-threonylcarbamoyltransferase complex dimerization subunit type 1 TsaB [Planctomycetota bacterium]